MRLGLGALAAPIQCIASEVHDVNRVHYRDRVGQFFGAVAKHADNDERAISTTSHNCFTP